LQSKICRRSLEIKGRYERRHKAREIGEFKLGTHEHQCVGSGSSFPIEASAFSD
jgi:hypothetical protein